MMVERTFLYNKQKYVGKSQCPVLSVFWQIKAVSYKPEEWIQPGKGLTNLFVIKFNILMNAPNTSICLPLL